jgi:ABC-type Fe3+ transport system permease subunit
MKRLLRIFELSKNEQRVVLIVMLVLIVIAFVRYERRVHRQQVQTTSATEPRSSPSPIEAKDE